MCGTGLTPSEKVVVVSPVLDFLDMGVRLTDSMAVVSFHPEAAGQAGVTVELHCSVRDRRWTTLSGPWQPSREAAVHPTTAA